MARVALPQSKVRARRKRQRIIIASFVLTIAVLIFGGLVWLAHASFLRSTTAEVSGATTLDPQTISNAVLSDLSGSYLYLFPKNNIFLYPKQQTEADLLTQLPTIAKVTIGAKNFTALGVTVTERARKALWCGSSTTDPSACFWLDQDGLAYAAASSVALGLEASSTYEHYYGSLTGDAPQHFVTPEQFHALSALVDALSQSQTDNSITSIEVGDTGDVRITFANNFALLFSLTSAGADVYQRFNLALTSDVFTGHQLGDFQYLDLRFGDKLYYKLRASSTPATSK